MYIAKLDFKRGSTFIDSTSVELDDNGVLIDSIAKKCSPPTNLNYERSRYHLLGKVSVFGQSASCVIEVGEGRILRINFLFDLIEFFESSILESAIVKAYENSLSLKFLCDHPSTAYLDVCEWGSATFFYDAKPGDLSLDVAIKR
ncbi:hypothetical protein AB2N08_09380 [Massilia aurea]|uniref:hypothetical protein n=1 Tax=Massilia aurea TaxID=373040 RepID=UPI003461F643